MSGRSAYVRKEKEKTKTKTKDHPQPISSQEGTRDDRDGVRSPGPTFEDLSRQNSSSMIPEDDYYTPQFQQMPGHTSARSIVSSNSDDQMAYARVRKPPVPVIDVSGIEKSSFRQLMDRKSDGVRKGLSFAFAKKKKTDELPESRPTTSQTIRQEAYEVEAPTVFHQPLPLRANTSMRGDIRDGRPGPPQGQLPPLPPPPQLKRWAGTGRPPQPWNKLRKDPELWDPNGDTLIYLGQESHHTTRPPPSFRISSHVLENTESRFFITILREGITDASFDGPASPVIMGGPQQRRGGGPPIGSPSSQHSDLYSPGTQEMDGQISYELYFPPPANLSMVDTLRHHVTTRNVFALLYQTSLAGFNLYQALQDLSERLQLWMPPECDVSGMIIDYLTARGIDDVRNEPSTAISLLAWSEQRSVRWVEGWREAFIHCTGMFNLLDSVPELRNVTPITKALLDRASLEVQVRIQAVEDGLADFQFDEMFPPSLAAASSPERASFERLGGFLKQYYQSSCGTWPPPPVMNDEQWLNRGLVHKLSQDFGALYDYLVDRSVLWDPTEHPSTRQWTLIRADRQPFSADPPDLPFTSLLLDFDTRHDYPHIPHPYPLLPISTSPTHHHTDANPKLTERKAALAYAEATNIYRLGADFPANRLVDAFVRFEKSDAAGARDPAAARTGRWLLLYAVLQALASIAVDAPCVRFRDTVTYHLSPRLRGTPPWKSHVPDAEEAGHEDSHCWVAPRRWAAREAQAPARRPSPYDRDRRQVHNVGSRRAGQSSVRSSGTTTAGTESEDNVVGSPGFDDVPPLLMDVRRRRAGDGRGSASASASGTESDTASSVRSPVSARSMPRRRNGGGGAREYAVQGQVPLQTHLPPLTHQPLSPIGGLYGKDAGMRLQGYGLSTESGAGKDGYGRGIERVRDVDADAAEANSLLDIEWPVRGESRLALRGAASLGRLRDGAGTGAGGGGGGGVVIRDFDEYRF